jgi:glutamate/tyrosine decarboxylase-like PLP-dependent enzyme
MTSSPTRSPDRLVDEALMRRTTNLAVDFLSSLPDRPVGTRITRDELLASLGGALDDDGVPAIETIERLAEAADPGIVGMAGPRFFGFVIGGSLPAALAADWLTSTWDQNAGLFVAGPAASVVEEVVGGWLVDLLGLPEGTSIGLTTGCQMAHLTCLAAARHAVLERVGWNVEGDGLFGAPEITVVIGAEAHATIGTALQYLGLGRTRTTIVETDEQGRLRVDLLEAALPEADAPLIVCLQAGNVNTGSFDPMGEAIDVVRARSPHAWMHVDGAFGLWAAATPAYRHLVAGHDRADSWATDGHKWLNVPYDSGYAFVRDPEQHRAAMSPQSAAYIVYGASERDEFHWVPEYSRRARGFATYAAIRSLGRRGIAEQIDRSCRQATRMADALRAAPGVEILNNVVLDQVLVRFHPRASRDGGGSAGDTAATDAWTREIVRRVQEDGTCWLAGSTWHGKAAMRISIVNWSTTDADIDRSAAAILRAAEVA